MELRPAYTDARYNLGLADRDTGQLEQAERQFGSVVRLEPQHVGGHYQLGLIHLVRKKYAQAAAEFEWALAGDPANGDARRALERARDALRSR